MARLLVLEAAGEALSEHGLRQQQTTIGRGLANTIVVRDDPAVSLRHATLRRVAEGYLLCDEGSANGSWVEGGRVSERLLEDGDQIQLGNTVMVFRRR